MDDIHKWWYCRLHVIWAIDGQQLPLDLAEDITRLKVQGWRVIDVVKHPGSRGNEEVWVLQRSCLENWVEEKGQSRKERAEERQQV
jgi:hypothetical protein